ncbi:hypothetical protein RS130_20675 [Paraglaciecola aquimarina]|uniref:Dystroglycan-type cadherin-like domain-containing protein n=1 Tax=Paraglaciecola aquimarina TaxID=1235557 RepID=A0ABU3T148_9ALTE|nr:putative Ig domain-containing protein [Paraglaciecola aquimarina]MDU0355983.1 hypothetical protein [Paraglaciecola aquimarina]
MFGTQKFGFENYPYTEMGETEHFVIPIGEYLSGEQQYLFFTMDHDVNSPNATSIFSNIMIYEKPASAPEITSTPDLSGFVGIPYRYDTDYRVSVNSQLPVTYTLNNSPDGMTIDEVGQIYWTPTHTQIGSHEISINVLNQLGANNQQFTIEVTQPAETIINFSSLTFQSYGGSYGDTSNGIVAIEDNGATLKLEGNRWQAAALNYIITPNTTLEFAFKSTSKGDIHGIGLDTDLLMSADTTFNLFGTQQYGFENYKYTGSGEYQHFSIPIGQYYTGTMNYFFFTMDHDNEKPSASSYFSRVLLIN